MRNNSSAVWRFLLQDLLFNLRFLRFEVPLVDWIMLGNAIDHPIGALLKPGSPVCPTGMEKALENLFGARRIRYRAGPRDRVRLFSPQARDAMAAEARFSPDLARLAS